MTIEEYWQKLKSHDWYYDYSDDHSVWQRGGRSKVELQAACQENELFARMYTDYSNWMFKSLPEREDTDPPKLEDYL